MAIFRTVYRIVQRYAPLTGLEGDADLIPLALDNVYCLG